MPEVDGRSSQKTSRSRVSLGIAILIAALVGGWGAGESNEIEAEIGEESSESWLLSSAELDELEATALRMRGDEPRICEQELEIEGDGPNIKVLRPENQTVYSPVEIKVLFEPRGSEVDLDSFRIYIEAANVKGLKWWLLNKRSEPFEITKKVKKVGRLTKEGLEMAGFPAHVGCYRISARLSDVGGRFASMSMGLDVLEAAPAE